MGTIRIGGGGTAQERLHRLEQANNFEEEIFGLSVLNDPGKLNFTTAATAGGFCIPWDALRKLLPDDRWAVWACGWLAATGTGITIGLEYQNDAGGSVPLGSTAIGSTGGGWIKAEVGPFAVRGDLAVGVPQGENIPCINITATPTGGANCSMTRWSIWLRMSPRAT